MANGMPELGSKISLISKADIRYEGRLFTVDPQECTIALANVRSFGTEDRETQYPIAPQSQIYDYILFRGSDIKDIRVVNNSMPHPTDPAIMQMQLPNGQHVMPHFPPMQPMNTPMGNYPPQQPQPASGVVGFGGGGGGGVGSGGSNVVGGVNVPPPGLLQQQQQQLPPPSSQPLQPHPHPPQPPHPQQQHHHPSVGGPVGSSSTSSSTATAGGLGLLNVGGSGSSPNIGGTSGGGLMAMTNNNLTNTSSNSNNDLLAGASRSTTPLSLLSRNKSPSADMAVQVNQQQNVGNRDAGHKRQQNQQQPISRGTYNRDRRDSGRGNNDYAPNQYDNRNQYQRNNNNNQQNRGGWMNRNNNMNMNNMRNPNNRGGRGNGGPPRMSNQGFRPQYINKGGRPGGKPLKFDDDFDFEKANTQFEELINVFSKTKVSDDPKTEVQVNGEIEKKDDSGNETGAGEHENEEENICYDKTKSFFDSISCEAAQDRSKNKKNDWRQERKINTETFGIPAKRTGYRGRGNFYNRNINNYRGYRPQNNGYQHNRNRNYNTRPQSTGIPIKSVPMNPTGEYNTPADIQSPQQPLKTQPESIIDSSQQAVVAAVK
ncbi:LSM14A family protein [Megaselia abdita]